MLVLRLPNLRLRLLRSQWLHLSAPRSASSGCLGFQHKELTPDLKHRIETHWRHNLGSDAFETNTTAAAPKTYVLSMFPYPSGQLHMGHVRVYAISDAMARFYRMCGHRVLHPMGWDAFGLPAENAARQRGVAAADWTRANIAEMRTQLERLGCSFDWQREVCTSEPEYYRWTQWLFLRLHDEGMVYQAEALVNWDPVDETVLADEQVDAQGCSWRSGARVEKKLLRQWFVRTTRFAQRLLDGLNDEGLQDWRDIIKLQRHWIGECDGYRFEMPLEYDDTDGDATTTLRLRSVSLWTRRPEELRRASFVAVSPEHLLAKLDANAANDAVGEKGMVLRGVRVRNPFDDGQRSLPVVVVGRATGDEDATEARIVFDEGCDTYLGVVSSRRVDRLLASQLDIECGRDGDDITGSDADELCREAILREAQSRNIGGWPVSSKLKDWPISRQRAWGTPIPIVHCANCGAVPVPDAQLPVLLAEHANAPDNTATTTTTCPKCQAQDGRRESDTMDTFVDSSWYFLRYMDPHNREEPFSRAAADRTAPVDLYVGGKEHAVLHLYYARFMTQFLHSIGRVPVSEPFRRLLVQGMVMGRSYRVKGSGRYLRADEVCIVDAKKNLARTLAGDEAVVMQWEKMSKSKLNGADPTEAMDAHGTDSIRLIMLGDVAPTSHRNWSETTFPGILNWQKRLWLTLVEFNECRTAEATDAAEEERIVNSEAFREQESKLYDARNYFLKEATFNYKYSHQLSVAISKMQGLTNSIRRAPKDVIKYGHQYERALAAVIQMLAPMAPHFASELWSQFASVPGRRHADGDLQDLNWTDDVLQQRWPMVDAAYQLDLVFKVNGVDVAVGKYTAEELRKLTADQALDAALECAAVQEFVNDRPIVNTSYAHYDGCEAIITISLDRRSAVSKSSGKSTKKVKAKQ